MRKRTKFFLLRASIILTFALLAGRVWYMQVVMGSSYQQQADTSKIRVESVQALRGIIYDRNGHQLVFNAPSWNVEIVPHGIPVNGAWTLYRKLSQVLGGTPTASRIAAEVRSYMWRQYAPFVLKANVSAEKAMVIKQLHVELPGVLADPASVRQYVDDPQNSLAHALGYALPINQEAYSADTQTYPHEHYGPTDQTGVAGVEGSMDAYLHGVNGNEEVEVDAGERPIRTLQPAWSVPGDSVYLTINSGLQQQVTRDLQAALSHLGLRKGVAIVEDVHSGQILSMVSLPSFNNNWFAGGISQKRWMALNTDPDHPLDDMATAGQFPPGSTYKIITAAAALETHVADPNRLIDDTGQIDLGGGQIFSGWKAGGLGEMNIVSAISHSSDIYFYTVAGGNPNDGPMPSIGSNRLAHWARLFGLGTKTGIEIPGEQPGLVPSSIWFNQQKPAPNFKNPGDVWTLGQTYNMAIGQGFNLATPLQMVNVAAAIANKGILYRPRIVEAIKGRVIPSRGVLRSPKVIQPFVPSIIRRNFLSPSTLELIQEGMHDSVRLPNWEGTSYYVQDPRIDAAGKTGTAEAKLPDGTPDPHAWWVGYAPFNNPKIAVCVMVPNANAEGAYVAAPIAHKVFEDYFHLKPYSPDQSNWLLDVQHVIVGAGAQ